MTKLTTHQMLDLSTGHLSLATREFLDATAGKKGSLGHMAREEGYVVSTYPGEEENWREITGIPKDLLDVLRFACANGQDWVLFDIDGAELDALPYYGDGNDIERPAVEDEGAAPELGQQENVTTLDSGDYKAENSLWVEMGASVVHIFPLTEEVHGESGVKVAVYPGPHPDDPDQVMDTCSEDMLIGVITSLDEDVLEKHRRLSEEHESSGPDL